MTRVLLTRPHQQSRATASRLERKLAFQPVFASLTEIETTPPPQGWEEGAQAVVVTSTNAALTLGPHSPRVFAVGARTAQMARRAGAGEVVVGPGTAAELAEAVAEACDPAAGAVVYLRGRDIAYDLEARLRARGFETRSHIVYDAVPVAQPFALVREPVDAVLVYSARAARLLCDRLREDAAARQAVAQASAVVISDAVAAALDPSLFARIVVAQAANEDALLAALEQDITARD